MSISYKKLLLKFEELGIKSTQIKEQKIMGQATWKKIKDGGNINTSTINDLCKLLHCQPGDIMEYVEDEKQ